MAKERLPLFITKLIGAKWESGAIKIEFNAGSEDVHTRFLSKDYARELSFALLRLLAAAEPEPSPPFDDLKLEEDGSAIRFTLMRQGAVILTGSVTKSVAERANEWLGQLFDGPNVFRIKGKKKRA